MTKKLNASHYIALIVKALETTEMESDQSDTERLEESEKHLDNFFAVVPNPSPEEEGLKEFIADALLVSRDIDKIEESYQNSKDEALRNTLLRQLDTLHEKRIYEIGYACDRAKEIKAAHEASRGRE